ncbi:MAG: TolC family protein [Gammaproteobacteria bacterium]|nr:TolC family protein [Gammaproteobacteria bacterium]
MRPGVWPARMPAAVLRQLCGAASQAGRLRRRTNGAALVGVLVLLAGQGAMAAESLQQAWAQALQRDPALAASEAETEAAEARLRAARGARLPALEASASYARFADAPALEVAGGGFALRTPPIFDDDDTVIAGARLALPLYAGGSLAAGVAAAEQGSRAAQAAARQAAAGLRLDVAGHYVAVLRARRALAAADATVESLDAHVADVQVMVDRETVATSDLLAARVALANARQQQLRAANAVLLAQAAYNRRLGQPLDRVPELDERLVDGASDPIARPLASLVEAALANRDELGALAAQAAAFDAQARAERGRSLPQVALTAAYDHLETTVLDREQFASAGIGLRWTLFDGGQARARAAALRRQGDAARLRRDDLRTQLELQVREAWLGVGEADARRTAAGAAVAQADENLRISRELYGAGLVTHTQVLDAIALRITAVNDRDDAEYDAGLARLRLQWTVGEL